MKLFITGASGFIGSHIVSEALAQGHEVAVLSRSAALAPRLAFAAGRIECIAGDLTAIAGIAGALTRFAPDAVIHAAWFGVGNQHRNDHRQVTQNLDGSVALVELAAAAGAQVFVGFGSQAEYGPHEGPLNEEAVTNPTTRYGVAKLAAGHLGRIVAAEQGVRFAWLRLFSSYGPGDNPGWLLPYVIGALLRGERPALTAGEQRWDFIHAADVARAALAVAGSPQAAGVFNLGSGEAPALRRTLETVRDLIDPALPLGFGEVPYRPDQVMWLQADIGRISSITGWRPQVRLEDGLREAIAAARATQLQPSVT